MSKIARTGTCSRKTAETDISVTINLDGTGKSNVDTSVPFMDHMLELFAKHGLFDLDVKATGDIHIDYHHIMEDMGLVIGEAIKDAVADKAGIKRYGTMTLPMDEALVSVTLDLSGRPYLVYDLIPPSDRIKDLDTALFHEFFQAVSVKAGMNLHIQMLKGQEVHHVFEAVFKAFAKALDQATIIDERIQGAMTTKGIL